MIFDHHQRTILIQIAILIRGTTALQMLEIRLFMCPRQRMGLRNLPVITA